MKTLLLTTAIAFVIGSAVSAQECETHNLPLIAAVSSVTQVAVKDEVSVKPAVEITAEKSAETNSKAEKKDSGKMDYFVYDYGFWWTPVD